MGAFRQRQSASDRTDILHLLGTYEDEARAVRGDLDREDVDFFVEAMPGEDQPVFREMFGV